MGLIMLIVYVDDTCVFESDVKGTVEVKNRLKKTFKTKRLGPTMVFSSY